jgi:hypothetical protein
MVVNSRDPSRETTLSPGSLGGVRTADIAAVASNIAVITKESIVRIVHAKLVSTSSSSHGTQIGKQIVFYNALRVTFGAVRIV